MGLGLQYVRVSRAEEMRRAVRGGRSEGRFTRGSTRPLIRQDARGERSQKTCETRNKKVALELAQEPRGVAQCARVARPTFGAGLDILPKLLVSSWAWRGLRRGAAPLLVTVFVHVRRGASPTGSTWAACIIVLVVVLLAVRAAASCAGCAGAIACAGALSCGCGWVVGLAGSRVWS